MSIDSVDRREFLKRSAQAAAAVGLARSSVWGANERLQVGFVGVGIRGDQLLRTTLRMNNVKVVAICDAYQGYVKRGVDRVKEADKDNTPAAYDDIRRILEDKNVEAVVVSTPEHRHVEHVLQTLAAGKDIYIEKPLTHSIEEGAQMMKALAKAGPRVVQVGTQRRSSLLYSKAREMVKAGMLGKITNVRAFWYRNSLSPQWRYPIPADASPQTANWEAFLGPAPKRPWDAARYFQWRLYWDYSGGIATDLMTHQIDAVQMVLDEKAPESVFATGGIYNWNDGREVPDTFHSILTYKSGFIVDYTSMFANQHYGYGEQFLGSEGTLEVMNARTLNFYPEKFMQAGKDVTPDKVKARAEITLDAQKDLGQADIVQAHLEDFYNAVKSRKPTNCPLDVGDQAATPCHLATLSFRQKRQILWDPVTRKAKA